jgi:uncharacterized phage protein (TIGR01671 family)
MREIKFRGRAIRSKKWKYGSLVKDESHSYIILESSQAFTQSSQHWSVDAPAFIVEKDSVSQFTSVRDSNKREVYGGDIIKVYDDDCIEDSCNFKYHEVVYGNSDYPAFDLKPRLTDDMNSLSFLACSGLHWFEVCGNVHENGELLK